MMHATCDAHRAFDQAVSGRPNMACIGAYLEEVYKQSFIDNSEALVQNLIRRRLPTVGDFKRSRLDDLFRQSEISSIGSVDNSEALA